MYYNMDEIKTALEKDIETNKTYIEKWRAVTFPTKKDGKPFSVMSKNIVGAKYAEKPYMLGRGEYELTVSCWSPREGYVSDSINAYELVRYLKDEKMLAKKENYMPKETYLEQVYKFDLEDIKNAVKARIDYLESYVADLEKQLANLETVYKDFRTAIAAAFKTLEDGTKDFEHKNLYYAVKDCVLSRYPYC